MENVPLFLFFFKGLNLTFILKEKINVDIYMENHSYTSVI